MPFPALEEAQGKLDLKRKQLAEVFGEAGDTFDMDKIKSISGDTAAKVSAIRTMNEEINGLAVEVEGFLAVQKAAASVKRDEDANKIGRGERGAEQGTKDQGLKSLGDRVLESKAWTDRRGSNGPEVHLDIETKTLFDTTSWVPETTRTGRIVDYATRPIQLIDLLPATTTNQTSVVYEEETTFTNAAAETAEAGTYPEAAIALTEKSSKVQKIAVWMPMTDEELEDEPRARDRINNRLPFMCRQRLDGQIMVGNGTTPNLRGFLNVVGIQTQAKGADPTPDAVFKAVTACQVTGRAMPGAVVFHPLNWQDIRLLRTADGVYIWGNPSDGGPQRIWGLPVVSSDAITQGTALVGDFQNYSELATKRGIDVQISNSHADYFVNGKQAIRADLRVALVVYRPAAFVTVTGL
jgi:HK97 family phage major capsid protein